MVCCVIVMVCSFHSLLWFVASIVALVFLFPLLSWFVTFIVSLVCCFHCCHSFSLSLMPWFVASIVVIICHFECFFWLLVTSIVVTVCHFHCQGLSLSLFVIVSTWVVINCCCLIIIVWEADGIVMCLIMVSQSCLLPMSVIIIKLLNDQRKTNTCLSMNIIIRRALSSTGLSLITFFHLHNVNNLSEQNCSLAKSLTSRRNCPDIPTSSSSSSCFCCCVSVSWCL